MCMRIFARARTGASACARAFSWMAYSSFPNSGGVNEIIKGGADVNIVVRTEKGGYVTALDIAKKVHVPPTRAARAPKADCLATRHSEHGKVLD